MWTEITRPDYERSGRRYASDATWPIMYTRKSSASGFAPSAQLGAGLGFAAGQDLAEGASGAQVDAMAILVDDGESLDVAVSIAVGQDAMFLVE